MHRILVRKCSKEGRCWRLPSWCTILFSTHSTQKYFYSIYRNPLLSRDCLQLYILFGRTRCAQCIFYLVPFTTLATPKNRSIEENTLLNALKADFSSGFWVWLFIVYSALHSPVTENFQCCTSIHSSIVIFKNAMKVFVTIFFKDMFSAEQYILAA